MDSRQEEQTLKQAILRCNTKTTHCLSDEKEFRVFGFQASLRVSIDGDSIRAVICSVHWQSPAKPSGISIWPKIQHWEMHESKFRDILEAFHSFTGVTQQLMNADHTAPFEVSEFKKWFVKL